MDDMAGTSATSRCVSAVRAALGEGPLWSARENAVYWVDIKGSMLHRLRLEEERQQSWTMPQWLCWVVERQNEPGFIAGFRDRIAALQLDPLRIETLCVPEPRQPGNRLNDAAVDCRGCIWFGTMDEAEQRSSGALYRLDPAGQLVAFDTGYIVSNGPAFSLECDWLFHTDSLRRTIYRFPLAADGRPGLRESFLEFPPGWGAPDGMATDEDGAIWVAHWGGGRVSRFLTDGSLDRVIELPVTQVTSCCFAGAQLDRMFVTSAAIGSRNEPMAGCLFEVSPGVRGAPGWCYGG